MQTQIKDVFQLIAFALNVFAGLVIVIAAVDGAVRYIAGFGGHIKDPASTDVIRLRLGRSLSLFRAGIPGRRGYPPDDHSAVYD